MTTIVANKKGIACDLQASIDGQKFKVRSKIERIDYCPAFEELGGFYIGFAGKFEQFYHVLGWMAEPDGKPPKLDGQLLVLTDSGKILYSSSGVVLIGVNEPFFAIGSGTNAALGALHQGATLKEAIKAASAVDVHTGMGCKEFTIK